MTMIRTFVCLVATSALLVSGCGKAKTPPPPDYSGVTVDLPKLQQTFAEAGPEAKQAVAMVQRNLRYSDYTKALMSLDELLNAPGVTDAQKKVATEVIEQVKKVISQAPAAPAAQ
jgi:hypothetical protein